MKINQGYAYLKISALFLLFGCSVINSSYHYTKGTECLESGDYDGAITHLQESVKLDPTMSRNHCNLTFAYCQKGEKQKAWVHAHKAVFIDPNNKEALINFYSLYKDLKFHETIITGISKNEVIQSLGEPDSVISSPEGKLTILVYGKFMYKFDAEQKLYEFVDLNV